MTVRRPAQSPLSLTPAGRSRENEQSRAELIAPAPVTAELTGATTAYVNHGLGRRYVGALVVAQDSGGGPCRVLPPDVVDAAGRDPRVVVGLSFASAFSGTVHLRVF